MKGLGNVPPCLHPKRIIPPELTGTYTERRDAPCVSPGV
jgi:hypothetical protein